MTIATAHAGLQHASMGDTLAFLGNVAGPTAAKGVIIRRAAMVSMAEAFGLDRRAVRTMQKLRRKYHGGPVLMNIAGRRQALILSPEDVHRVLEASPDPFATASMEKRAALSHFEPRGALISHGADRADRRRFNEEVLEHENPMHRLAAEFVKTVNREAADLIDRTSRAGGILSWDLFATSWFSIVRQVVFGRGAREDEELRDTLDTLRSHGNWAFLSPVRKNLREHFLARVRGHIDRAEPGSLAQIIASVRKSAVTAPEHQVPQWLFAFDPAGMTVFRSLALLASHLEYMAAAKEEVRSRSAGTEPLPRLRAAALEALRLWPTTPLVLRETARDVEWDGGMLPAKTGVVIYAPFFHRDDEQLPFADRFAPEIWMDGHTLWGPGDWPLIPFSAGPAACPGRQVVLLVVSAMVATIISGKNVHLTRPQRLNPPQPLPGTLNHFSLRFVLD
jgi:cytochrome P450